MHSDVTRTSSLARLEENMAAAKLRLTAEEWKRIEDWAPKK